MSNFDFKLYFYQNNQLFKKVGVEKGYHFNLIVGSSKDANICLDNKEFHIIIYSLSIIRRVSYMLLT